MTHSKDAVSNAETGGTRSRQQAPPSPRWFSHPAVAHLLALLGYALATVVFTWPLALNLTVAIPGDSFDGWQNFWNLWWVKIALVERVSNPLYTDLLYHPTGAGLYFQTLKFTVEPKMKPYHRCSRKPPTNIPRACAVDRRADRNDIGRLRSAFGDVRTFWTYPDP